MPRSLRVASVEEIPAGRGKTVEADGLELAVFNAGHGRFYACDGRCPHEDGPLGEGALEGRVAVCPWHGFDFDLETGRCLADPDLSVRVYPVRVEGPDLVVEWP